MASNRDDIPFLGFLQLFIKDVELRLFITDQHLYGNYDHITGFLQLYKRC